MDGYRFERVDWTDRTDTDRGGGGGGIRRPTQRTNTQVGCEFTGKKELSQNKQSVNGNIVLVPEESDKRSVAVDFDSIGVK